MVDSSGIAITTYLQIYTMCIFLHGIQSLQINGCFSVLHSHQHGTGKLVYVSCNLKVPTMDGCALFFSFFLSQFQKN